MGCDIDVNDYEISHVLLMALDIPLKVVILLGDIDNSLCSCYYILTLGGLLWTFIFQQSPATMQRIKRRTYNVQIMDGFFNNAVHFICYI